MSQTIPLAAPSAARHVLVGLALAAVGAVALAAGREAVSAFIGVMAVAAYVDLRRLMAVWGHLFTVALGAAGVVGFLWAGYDGHLQLLTATAGALVLLLLASRVVLFELGASTSGVTNDVAATLGAAGVAGVLGAHILLIRSVPRFGFRGLLVFGLMVLSNDAVAFFVGRWGGRRKLAAQISPTKTRIGTLAGFVTSVLVGVGAGLVADPPFDIRSGAVLGTAMGVLAPVGDLVFSAIKRSAGVRASGRYLGPMGGALDALDSVLFAAPAFYWAYRTIAL